MEKGTARVKRIHREVNPDGPEPLVDVGDRTELGVIHIVLHILFPLTTQKTQ